MVSWNFHPWNFHPWYFHPWYFHPHCSSVYMFSCSDRAMFFIATCALLTVPLICRVPFFKLSCVRWWRKWTEKWTRQKQDQKTVPVPLIRVCEHQWNSCFADVVASHARLDTEALRLQTITGESLAMRSSLKPKFASHVLSSKFTLWYMQEKV